MKFRFEFDIKKLQQLITHKHRLLLMGSCFTENIGEKLESFKFTTLQKPNGILFNPVSVAEALTNYIDDKRFGENDLFYFNEAWHSWQHHSRFSGTTVGEALEKINSSFAQAHLFLKEADCIFITLGSSWTYTLTDKATNATPGKVAANNHKAPADWFIRKLMTADEVLQVFDNLINRLQSFNPRLQLIFTISPVRHLREGVVENNRSKAVLIQAVHQLVEKFDQAYYFPAYELVIDDLRDYRFYAEDLVHPNYFATQYVWEKLVDACIDEKSKKLMEDIHTINLAFRHKPFNEQSIQHKKFLQSAKEKAQSLKEKHPYLNLDKELAYFESGSQT